MKKIFSVFMIIALVTGSSCKKTIDNKKKDLLIEAMTNGVWLVDLYTESGVDITADFAGYEFQFLEDGTVMGTKNSVMTHGTWVGDFNSQTISSQFPGAPAPLGKLNGTWKITDSYLDYVKSEMPVMTGKNVLHLKKKV
ncbi:MAG TPA: hypothetical protein VM012_03815 [Flavitalea sp.]|nr:hypothetical protein [Flavitalea sp.]